MYPNVYCYSITIARKQPRYSLTDEWIKKLWYIYTMEYYSATKEQNNATCSNTDTARDYHSK